MKWVRRLLLLAFVGAVLVGGWKFAAQNAATVSISYLFGDTGELPVWLVLVTVFGAGLVVAGAVGAFANARLRLVARRYRKTVEGLESEVHQLRNLPLAAEERASGTTRSGEVADDLPRGLLEGGA